MKDINVFLLTTIIDLRSQILNYKHKLKLDSYNVSNLVRFCMTWVLFKLKLGLVELNWPSSWLSRMCAQTAHAKMI